MKIDDSLSEVFNIDPIPKSELIVKDQIIDDRVNKIDSDYNTARENLLELLTTGQNALMHSLEVAKQSEHPRAFEVVGNLMKQLADVNQQLMDLHAQKKK